MARAPTLSDPRFEPGRRRWALDRWALRYIKDERDLPFVHLIAQISLVLLPFAVALYVPGVFRWWLGALYLVVNFVFFFDRFILMLHNTSHRSLFRKRHRRLNALIPWALGPLFGQTPDTYFAHHIGMHHPEENLEQDLSSTMSYRRDSFLQFLAYWARFFFAGLFELSMYHARRRRWKLFRMTVVGELAWWGAMALLLWVDWQATLIVLVIPFAAARFLMMAGNWAQHAFIDPAEPANKYKASIVCINTRYNRRCFNDGYHVGHHVKPNRHWTEMPEDFERDIERYVEADAVVFEGIDYFQIWWLLMWKRFDALARHFVDLRDEPRRHEEIVALLQERVRALPARGVVPQSSP
ncbi:MAG: fatty acid desaturase family protein [Polyangiales bacterium]